MSCANHSTTKPIILLLAVEHNNIHDLATSAIYNYVFITTFVLCWVLQDVLPGPDLRLGAHGQDISRGDVSCQTHFFGGEGVCGGWG